jgi:hypothetical protein
MKKAKGERASYVPFDWDDSGHGSLSSAEMSH